MKITNSEFVKDHFVLLNFLSLLLLLQVRRREPNQVRRREPAARPRTAEDVRRRSLPQPPSQSRAVLGQVTSRRSNTPPHSPSPRKPTPRAGQLAAPRYRIHCLLLLLDFLRWIKQTSHLATVPTYMHPQVHRIHRYLYWAIHSMFICLLFCL